MSYSNYIHIYYKGVPILYIDDIAFRQFRLIILYCCNCNCVNSYFYVILWKKINFNASIQTVRFQYKSSWNLSNASKPYDWQFPPPRFCTNRINMYLISNNKYNCFAWVIESLWQGDQRFILDDGWKIWNMKCNELLCWSIWWTKIYNSM